MHHVVPRLDRTPGSIRTPAPELGQHNREVLARAGVDDASYERLKQDGVVYEPDLRVRKVIE
jgi:formyl-CoA transferase